MRHSPFRTRRKSSTGEAGQEERLERVRLWTLEPMRTDSRRRMAGGELRLGTDSTYMGLLYNTYSCKTRWLYIFTWVHNAARKNRDLQSLQCLTRKMASKRAGTFGLDTQPLGKCPRRRIAEVGS